MANFGLWVLLPTKFRQHFEKDRALSRRFQKIDVNEPSVPDTIKILRGIKSYFEDHHNLKYTADAIKTAVELSDRYITDRKLPDKAIDVIDEAGAAQHLQNSKRRKTIGVKEIEEVVAKIARIPPKNVSKDDTLVLKDLEKNLNRVVFGQHEAIEALSSAIKLARAGLREPDKRFADIVAPAVARKEPRFLLPASWCLIIFASNASSTCATKL